MPRCTDRTSARHPGSSSTVVSVSDCGSARRGSKRYWDLTPEAPYRVSTALGFGIVPDGATFDAVPSSRRQSLARATGDDDPGCRADVRSVDQDDRTGGVASEAVPDERRGGRKLP